MPMGYVIAGAVLVLILVIGITLLRVNAKRHGSEGKRAAADSDYGGGVPGSDMAIVAEDRDAPLGDTTEHAGEQQEGATVADQDADRSGGTGAPAGGSYAGTGEIGDDERRADSAHVAPPAVGGEGEGRRRV
jgi:hypothetical protein